MAPGGHGVKPPTVTGTVFQVPIIRSSDDASDSDDRSSTFPPAHWHHDDALLRLPGPSVFRVATSESRH
eukprot:3314217-Rhodomonas_salina.3